MNKASCIAFLYLVLIVHSFSLFAQNEFGAPFIQNYDDKNFNTSEKQIWAILQDKRGIMYFGNNNGLLEFDGSNWRLIKIPNKSTVRSMAIDSTGRIYVSAKSEFGYIESDKTGTNQYFSLLEKIPEEHRNFDDVWETFVLNNQVIFRTNFYVFILKNNKIKILKSENRLHVSFCVNNRFYVREWGKGLLQLVDNSLKLIPGSEQFANERIYVMLPYEKDKILLFTRTQGIFIYSPNVEKPNRFSKPVRFKEVDNFNIKNQIYSGTILDNKHYVLGSVQDGLIIIDNNGTIVRHINKKSGLYDNTIITICVDSQKNIWTGLNNGISYIIVNSPFSLFSENSGLQGSVYTSIYYKNRLYAGTSLGIFRKDRQRDFFMLNNTKGQSWRLSEIREKLYCAHYEGILRINKNTAENIFAYGNTWTLLELVSNPGYVLAGTSDDGLILLEYKNGQLIVKQKIKGFDESSRWLYEDNESNIWISHENKGIFRLKLNEKLDSVTKLDFFNTKHGLPSNTYNYVFKIKTVNHNSKLIFGTENGIYNYDSKSNLFVPDETFNKLFEKSGYINIFIQDEKGNIWYKKGSEKGVLLLQNDGTYKSKITPFLKFKSLVVSIYVKDTANILFNTDDGIIHYNSQITPDYDALYPTLIRQVYANDSLIFGGTDNKENNLSGFSELPYKQNNLFFIYSALFYEDHDKTQYSYYLEGFEKKWSEWSLKTEKEYTNLPEGNYKFKVKAKNVYEKESTIAIYSFTILPPWYRTIWAYIVYILTSVFIFYIGIKINTRRLKAANLRLEKIVKERTAEIVKQNIELEKQKEEINTQKNEIEKQRDIVIQQKDEITDSIIYAKRIQSAVLPPDDLVARNLSQYFIMFKPRDIVSGDFYWMKRVDNYLIITVADCTGHGVPGAFMSMLGIALLNDIVRYKEISTASQALNELRNQIKAALRQSGKEGEAEDGIDMALCVIDYESMKMQFAGARNPLYIIRNKEFTEVKADKMPIGIYFKDDQSFTNHNIDIQNGDIFYLFSDGFIDQFGGTENKRYTSKQFKDLLKEIHNKPMPEQKVILNKTLTNWMDNEEQIDDITVLGFKI